MVIGFFLNSAHNFQLGCYVSSLDRDKFYHGSITPVLEEFTPKAYMVLAESAPKWKL